MVHPEGEKKREVADVHLFTIVMTLCFHTEKMENKKSKLN